MTGKGEEQIDRIFFPLEMMVHALPPPTDPPPRPDQAGFPEQRAGNLHRVVARHVFRGIGAFDIKMIGLSDHARRI
ncbi:hypothetical protein ASD74_20595 [Rhizobium sp. Root564]|nr:hypothetical protein ASD74_20595 [Rhizobium sp. Root564]